MKKEYRTIAGILLNAQPKQKENEPDYDAQLRYETWQEICQEFADTLQAHRDFNREEFMDACGFMDYDGAWNDDTIEYDWQNPQQNPFLLIGKGK